MKNLTGTVWKVQIAFITERLYNEIRSYKNAGGNDLKRIIWTAVISLLSVGIAACDIRKKRIPDVLTGLLALFGTAGVWLSGIPLWEHVLGAFVVSSGLFFINIIWSGVFGGGDIKYMAAAGWLLGIKDSLYAFFAALLLASVFCIAGLLTGRIKMHTRIPLGPYLCTGTALILWSRILRL